MEQMSQISLGNAFADSTARQSNSPVKGNLSQFLRFTDENDSKLDEEGDSFALNLTEISSCKQAINSAVPATVEKTSPTKQRRAAKIELQNSINDFENLLMQ